MLKFKKLSKKCKEISKLFLKLKQGLKYTYRIYAEYSM